MTVDDCGSCRFCLRVSLLCFVAFFVAHLVLWRRWAVRGSTLCVCVRMSVSVGVLNCMKRIGSTASGVPWQAWRCIADFVAGTMFLHFWRSGSMFRTRTEVSLPRVLLLFAL